jgi:murein DD-endopeptidase MepM/ murein hydrolase activator NlpD
VKNKILIASVFLFFSSLFLSAMENECIKVESSKLPYIKYPDSKDLVFRQFQEDADYNAQVFPDYKTFDKKGNEKRLILSFYKVHIPDNMDFLWLSSRLSPVFKDTSATLNRLSSADTVIAGKDLLICSFSGLFIPENAESAWEQLILKEHLTDGSLKSARLFDIDGKKFYFLERDRFDSTTSLFFLDTKMLCPLKSRVLTSNFGYRISPISGKWKFHSGIDLAAPEGTSVFACRAGQVSQTGYNATYGNFIILLHYNGMTSVYAHLSKISVEKGAKINGGTEIGKVGTTGASTGPHLHFELRKNGNPEDPGKMINF